MQHYGLSIPAQQEPIYAGGVSASGGDNADEIDKLRQSAKKTWKDSLNGKGER